jgi:hypothetical protein
MDRATFLRKILRSGFVVTGRMEIVHPEIANGRPLAFSVDWRQALADLSIQLREARARKRGSRFVRSNNFDARTRRLVEGIA